MLLKIIHHAHSILRWFLIILLLVAVQNAFRLWQGKKVTKRIDKKIFSLAAVLVYLEALIGCITYYLNWGGKISFGSLYNPVRVYFSITHPILMLSALLFITVGYLSYLKVGSTNKRFKWIFFFYAIGLILILVGIPWPFQNLGVSGWF